MCLAENFRRRSLEESLLEEKGHCMFGDDDKKESGSGRLQKTGEKLDAWAPFSPVSSYLMLPPHHHSTLRDFHSRLLIHDFVLQET